MLLGLAGVLLAGCTGPNAYTGANDGDSGGAPGATDASAGGGGGLISANGGSFGTGGSAGGGTGGSAGGGTGGSAGGGTGGSAGGGTGGSAGGGTGGSAGGGTGGSAGGGTGGSRIDALADMVAPQGAADGEACTQDGDCGSRHCKGRICCATACEGTCSSCARANTGKPDGTCDLVRAGIDPHDECAQGAQTCGQDGMCDGNGKCRMAGVDVVCGAETCLGGSYMPAPRCNGRGGCQMAESLSCQNMPCVGGTRCATSCGPSSPCLQGFYCDTGAKCTAKKPDGAQCDAGAQCVNGNCVEHVCCESACGTTCRSCLAANTGLQDGKCAPVRTGTDPLNQCDPNDASTCQLDGTCDGSGACRKHPAGTVCRQETCTNGASESRYFPAGTCNGIGTCSDPGAGTVCGGNLVCGGAKCKGMCSGPADCIAGTYCAAGGTCQKSKTLGDLCGSAAECSTGVCGGRCCTQACTCTQPSAGNRLKNPGFDADITSWLVSRPNAVSYNKGASFDGTSCPFSGSVQLIINDGDGELSVFECVAVNAGATYNFGGRVRAAAVGTDFGNQSFVTFFASQADCMAKTNPLASPTIFDLRATIAQANQWYPFNATAAAPGGSTFGRFEVWINNDGGFSELDLDTAYLSPTPGQY